MLLSNIFIINKYIRNLRKEVRIFKIKEIKKPERSLVAAIVMMNKMRGRNFIPIQIQGNLLLIEKNPTYTNDKIFKAVINGININVDGPPKKQSKVYDEDIIDI